MVDKTSRAIFFFFVTCLVCLLTVVNWVEPFELRIRLVDSIYVGSGVPICALFARACAQLDWRNGNWTKKRNLFLLGLTICAFSMTASRGYWLFWRESGQPEWMRKAHTFWLSLTIIGGTLIFLASEVIDGLIAPRAWLVWLGITGAVTGSVLATIVLINWS